MRRSLLALLLIGLLTMPVRAQTSDVWPLGSRLRLQAGSPSSTIVGTLSEVQGDTLFLTTTRGIQAVLRRDLTDVAVSRGYHRYWLEGTLVGAGIGALLGTVFHRLCTSGNAPPDSCLGTTTYAAVGALAFGTVSGVAGYNVRSEWWRTADFAAGPRPDGPGLGFSLRF